jgi:hypothetical protein
VVDRYYAVRHLSRPERPGFLFYDGAINDGGVPSAPKGKGATQKTVNPVRELRPRQRPTQGGHKKSDVDYEVKKRIKT